MLSSEPPDVDELQQRALRRLGSTVAGKWQLERVLGVGGTAAVYAARHRNGKQVAVKVLHASLALNPDAVERFLDEAHAANGVGHGGVVSVLDDVSTDDGCAALVMELLEGETLDARLANAPAGLDVLEVLFVAEQLLDVLAAAHQRGILHRDIKPENVFLTSDGRIKLLDFGIARLTETRRTLRTQAGSTMGTPAFMPPEQARGRWNDIDARTDLWSVGATMFVALSGRLVHQGETMNEELLSAMTRPAPELSTVVPNIPKSVASIVDQALAFESKERYSDARAMQAAVRAAFLQLGGEDYRLPRVGRDASGQIALGRVSSPTTHRPVTTSGGVRSLAPDRLRSKRATAVLLVTLPLVVLGLVMFSGPDGDESARNLSAGIAPPPVVAAARTAAVSPPAPPPAPEMVPRPPTSSVRDPIAGARRARPSRATPSAKPEIAPPPPPSQPAANEPVDPLSRRK